MLLFACAFNLRPPPLLYNCLQLASIAYRVLDDLTARHQGLLLIPCLHALLREVDAAVLDLPASLLRELDNRTFAGQKQQILRVRDRD